MPIPTQTIQHKDLSLSNNHSGVSFTFVSGEPNFTGLTSADLYKMAIRTDDSRLFFLSSVNPNTWKELPLSTDLLHLGETSDTAYRGDRGLIAYNHSQVTHDKNLVGLGNVDNTADSQKPISNATQTELDLKQMKFVGICQKTPLTEANISFNHDTLVLTVTPSVDPGYFDFFTDGQGMVVKHRKSSPVDFPAITNTTGLWYFYFDSNGDPISSLTPWTNFDVVATVWRITWNATLTGADRIITNFVEYHQNSISSDDHAWKHANGTIWLHGFDAVHTALPTGTTIDVNGLNTCFSVTSGAAMDDNLYYSVTNSTDAVSWNQDCGNTSAPSLTFSNSGLFPVRYKGTGGLPVITTSNGRFPFLWNSGTNRPEYVNTSGNRVEVPDDNYFVYFVYSVQDPRTGTAIRLTPSYGTYTTLTLAQAITWANVQAQDDGAKDNEIRVLYRLIFQTSNSGTVYPSAVKYTVLREVTDLRKVIITQASVTGGSLPASSITSIPSGTLAATNVQSSLDELNLEKLGFIGNSLSSLPAYANNAAAVSGGLAVGSLYRTNGDPDLVCVVH